MKTSDSIIKIAPALLAAKKAFKPALKTAENPHFKSKYVDLQSVVEATEEALSANGLMLIQTPSQCESLHVSVTSRLLHTSGEWIEDTLVIPAGNQNRYDAQTVGSAITYARRYSYMGILGIAPEDDDGNVASAHASPQIVRRGEEVKSFKPAFQNEDRYQPNAIKMSKDQGDAFEEDPLFDENGDIVESKATVQHREQKQASVQAADDVPSVKPAAGKPINEAQGKRFIAIAKQNNRSWEQIDAALHAIGVTKASEIPLNQYDVFIEWAGGKNERRA